MKQRTNLLTIFIPLFILLSVVTIPYIWIILTSFKTRPDIMSTTPVWLFQPSWGNYVEIFHKDFGLYLTNSIVIGFSSTIIWVTIGTLAAYCFSRYKVFAGDHLFFYILATRLGPPAAYGVPMYLILDKLGLTNTHIAIILAHATFNLAIIVWMMKSFFDDVPKEVEEAAYLDGCNPYRTFYRISLPLAFPGLVAASIFALIFSWNELFFSLILTSGETRTLPVMIPSLAQHTGTQWGQVAAASIIQSIPVLIFIFFMQRWLVRGLTFGAVKG